MSVVINGTGSISGLSNVGGVASAQSGSVIQTVYATYSTNITTTSTSLATTNVTASITPQFSTSKILLLVSMNGCYSSSSGNNLHFELYKNGGSISYLEDILLSGLGGGNGGSSYQYLDSPATTSSTAYAIYWKSNTGSQIGLNNYYSGNNRTVSSITLLEIAA